VPITLQTLFVLLSGAVAGPAWGLLGQSAYLFGGVLGVPLFAGSVTGLAVLSGPTGGYLLGFVAAAYLIGKLIGRRTGYRWTLFVFSLGSLAILSLGALHLCLFAGGDVSAALRMGVLPFLAGDAAKTMAAASMYESYRRLRSPRRAR
jgi:biotin transport system substrate-specific component